MPWCVGNLGKVWSIIYADYAWGQSTNQESKLFIEKAGGKVLTSIPVPLDTKDFVPYLAQIPTAGVVLPAFIGSLSVAFYTQAKTMGLDKKMKMFSSSASLDPIDPGDIQGAAEGVYFFENFRACWRTRTTSTTRSSTGSSASTTSTAARSAARA